VARDVFAVLADPSRRRIVELLHGGEKAVGDLVDGVGIAQPGVSRHLRILHEGGLVKVRADGQRRLYSLRPQPLRELEAWMRRYAHAESERIERLAAFVDGPEAARQPPPRGRRDPG
jgi:DNA-binding transcriptional ArsR family regulator